MSGNTVAAVILFVLVTGGVFYLYQQGYLQVLLERNNISVPEVLELNQQYANVTESAEVFNNSITFLENEINVTYPTLVPNPRWNHMPIKFYMNVSSGQGLRDFGDDDLQYVRSATRIWEDRTDGIISFLEVSNPSQSELNITWFAALEEIQGGKVVGEGGPNRAFSTGGIFTLIEGGEIFLIPSDDDCLGINRPVHEIGHVLGLGHVAAGFGEIMFSKELSCNQNITSITSNAIKELYKLPAAADLALVNVSAAKAGAFVDVNFTVANIGLKESEPTSIRILTDGKEIGDLSKSSVLSVEETPPGSGTTRRVSARVSSGLLKLEIVVDKDDLVKEMDEGNNKAVLAFSPA